MISIIIPIYNAEAFLPRCVDSILSQSFKDFEVLLVDDGSTDKSGKICDGYAQKDPRVMVFHKKNGGVSSARNLGIDHARGEYIHFVDADDFVFQGAYKYFAERCLKYKPDITLFNHVNNAVTNQEVIEGVETFYNNSLDYIKNRYVRVPLWQKIIKREYITENGIRFNEKLIYSEDTVFLWSLLRNKGSLLHSTATIYSYSTNNESAERSRNVSHVKNTISSIITSNLHLKEYSFSFSNCPPAISNFTHKYEVLFNRILCTPYSYRELKDLFARCAQIGTEHLCVRREIKAYDTLYHHPLCYYLLQSLIRKVYFRRHKFTPQDGDFIEGLIKK